MGSTSSHSPPSACGAAGTSARAHAGGAVNSAASGVNNDAMNGAINSAINGAIKAPVNSPLSAQGSTPAGGALTATGSLGTGIGEAVGASASTDGTGSGGCCSRCGGSGMLRHGDQRFRTCLDCLGQGRLLAEAAQELIFRPISVATSVSGAR